MDIFGHPLKIDDDMHKLRFELKLRQNPASELHYLLIAIFQYIGHMFLTLLDHKALQEAPIACSIQ